MTFKQIMVRLPRLLDKDLNEVRRLRPRAQTIELNIALLSTASLTLEDGSGVGIRSFVELYNAKGSVGIYRTTLPDASYNSGERISLEHGICTLDDAVITGKGKLEGTPVSVLSGILAHQTTHARGEPMWTLGAVEAPNDMTISIEYDGTKTLEALSDAMRELQGYMLTFDQSGFPWVMNVVKKPENVACEGRLSRNIRTIRKTEDDSDLCTRLYCSLLDGGYIESDTVSVWGVVEQNITLNDDMPKDAADAYCKRYLENRKNPVVAIEIDALEWFAMTGERIDRFEIGDICRVALPDYCTEIEERIVALSYTNALGMPETVTVSLANQIEDLSIKTADIKRDVDNLKNKSTGYGNQLRTTNTEIQHLKEEAEDFKEVDGKIVKWFSSAQINLDATEEGANVGILATYQETYDLFSGVDTRITQAELILHGGPDGAQAGLIAKVEENSKGITTQNTALLDLKADAESATASLSARVGENEAAITATANELQSELELKADKITLNGYVTASQLKTEFTNFENGISDSLYVAALSANRFECSSFAFKGYGMSLKRTDYVKSVGRTKRYAKSPDDVTIEIWEISSISNGTLYYMSWE